MDYILGFFTFVVNNAPYLAGIVLPPLVEVLNRDVQNDQERYIVAVLVCLIAAVALHFKELLSGSPNMVAASFFIIFTESQTVFRLYFKTSLLRTSIRQEL